MKALSLYDDDILLWSEEQARLVRSLADARRNLPKDLDIENVAEEIESVGRSELASVESYLRLVFIHAIKLYTEPGSPAQRHWRREILGFTYEIDRRFAPSMRQRIDLDHIWRRALDAVRLDFPPDHPFLDGLPFRCPFAIEDLLGERVDGLALARRLEHEVAALKPARS